MAKKGKDKRPTRVRYTSTKRWLVNQLRKLRRHCRRFPRDLQSAAALKRLDG